jgi:hypothetical protein
MESRYTMQAGPLSTSLATSETKLSLGVVHFDPASLTVSNIVFEAILQTSASGNPAFVDLFNLTTNTVVATSELSTAALVPTRVTVAIAELVSVSPSLFQARLWMAPANPAQAVICFYAGLIVPLV